MTDISDYADRVSQYDFPYIETEYEYRYITVERRGRAGVDSWAIVDSPYVYQPKGRRWVYERRNSSRTDKFLKASRMTLEEALPIAEKQAKNLTRRWNRRLARRIAYQEAVAAEKAKEANE
jgi:hypothetical protein